MSRRDISDSRDIIDSSDSSDSSGRNDNSDTRDISKFVWESLSEPRKRSRPFFGIQIQFVPVKKIPSSGNTMDWELFTMYVTVARTVLPVGL